MFLGVFSTVLVLRSDDVVGSFSRVLWDFLRF